MTKQTHMYHICLQPRKFYVQNITETFWNEIFYKSAMPIKNSDSHENRAVKGHKYNTPSQYLWRVPIIL